MHHFTLRFAQKGLLALAFGGAFWAADTLCAPSIFQADSRASKDVVIGDFEGADYGGWKTQETDFGINPMRGEVPAQLGEAGIRGGGTAICELNGDVPRKALTSPVFTLARHFLSFVSGKVVRSATGTNSSRLKPVGWEVSCWRGKPAQIRLVDNASGNWGHIIVDQTLETDRPEKQPVVVQPLYQETWRPQFHFTARQWTEQKLNPGQREEGWCNDLNGLVYYDGEYHLFAQRWAKCWLHAVSRDLVHWTERPPAFWEEAPGSGVQSGSCVIDYGNTSGLSPDKSNPPMVAFWSRFDNRSQCLSYSLDHGRTWKRYEKNPIFVYPERDPNVFWYKPGKHWVMVMYGGGQYHILTSPNLLDWTDTKHPIPNSFECPDFFPLLLDGDKSQMKWVLVRGNGKYSIGSFNGLEFKEETPQLDSDAGPNFYATQSWGNTDTGDGRRIQAAWMRGGVYPDMPFNQQVTFPCELTLHSTPDGPRLHREPIHEIVGLHKHEDKWANRSLADGETWDLKQSGDLFHIKMEVGIPEGATLTLHVRGVSVLLTHQTVACGTEPQHTAGNLKAVEILVDRTSIETFANHGEVSISRCFLPSDDALSLKASGSGVILHSLCVYQLNSAWKDTRNLAHQ